MSKSKEENEAESISRTNQFIQSHEKELIRLNSNISNFDVATD